MSFEDWITLNRRGAYTVDGAYLGFILPEPAVREQIKGKVLVSASLFNRMESELQVMFSECEEAGGSEASLNTAARWVRLKKILDDAAKR